MIVLVTITFTHVPGAWHVLTHSIPRAVVTLPRIRGEETDHRQVWEFAQGCRVQKSWSWDSDASTLAPEVRFLKC